MADIDASSRRHPLARAPEFGRLGRQMAVGFAYWWLFDLVLMPGRIAHAVRMGAPVAWDQEALRLAGAGLLGAAATPVVLALVRRFPIEGPTPWRRTTLHLVSSAVLSAVMIAASCPLAAWLLVSERRPLAQALPDQMTGNLLLLTFCMAGFVALAHAARFAGREAAAPRSAPPRAEPASAFLQRIAVKTRAGLLMVHTEEIDWIETQGNYLALHVGAQIHLIRDTSKRLETVLDPGQFVRTHRQFIVAVDCVQSLRALDSGDAAVRLVTGAEIRVSRGYRQGLQARLSGASALPAARS
jgi:hypothetical protein